MKEISLDDYDLSYFNDSVTYTRLLARSATDPSVRARAKVAVAFCDMMDIVEPGWRAIALQNLKDAFSSAGLEVIPVGDIGLNTLFDIQLGIHGVTVKRTRHPDSKSQ